MAGHKIDITVVLNNFGKRKADIRVNDKTTVGRLKLAFEAKYNIHLEKHSFVLRREETYVELDDDKCLSDCGLVSGDQLRLFPSSVEKTKKDEVYRASIYSKLIEETNSEFRSILFQQLGENVSSNICYVMLRASDLNVDDNVDDNGEGSPARDCLTFIVRHLYNGRIADIDDEKIMLEYGVSWLVRLVDNFKTLPPTDLPSLSLSIARDATNFGDIIPKTNRFIFLAMLAGENIMVTSETGNCRSVAVIAAFLSTIFDISMKQIVSFLRYRVKDVGFTSDYENVLRLYENSEGRLRNRQDLESISKFDFFKLQKADMEKVFKRMESTGPVEVTPKMADPKLQAPKLQSPKLQAPQLQAPQLPSPKAKLTKEEMLNKEDQKKK